MSAFYANEEPMVPSDTDSTEDANLLDTLIVKAVSGAIIAEIKSADYEGSWKEMVLTGFEDAWSSLDDDNIWHRLIILVAFNAARLTEGDINEVLNNNLIESADELKDDIIDAVLHADVNVANTADEDDMSGEDSSNDGDDSTDDRSESGYESDV
jgi:hypothetical protein